MLKPLPLQIQPSLERRPAHLAHRLAHDRRNAHPHQLLEMADVGHQVGVQVVAVQRAPEGVVARAAQVRVQHRELLHRFAERRVADGGRGAAGGGEG